MRVRISKGWKISRYYGHLLIRGADLLTVPHCHKDFTFTVQLDTEEGVEVMDSQLYMQVALLYTNSEAERRIRVLTLSLIGSNNQQEIIQSVDPASTAVMLCHMAIDNSVSN